MTREQFKCLKVGTRVKLNCNYFDHLRGAIGNVLFKSIVGKEVFLAVSFHVYNSNPYSNPYYNSTYKFTYVNYIVVDVLDD